jgi:hypothetical protein
MGQCLIFFQKKTQVEQSPLFVPIGISPKQVYSDVNQADQADQTDQTETQTQVVERYFDAETQRGRV